MSSPIFFRIVDDNIAFHPVFYNGIFIVRNVANEI